MCSSRRHGLLLLLVLASMPAFAAKAKPCVPVDQAGKLLKQNICISAHLYQLVEVSDGTIYLDVCSPSTPDAECRFTVVVPLENRQAAGDLQKVRNKDVRIRGTVRLIGDRPGILLTNSRQLLTGKSRFKPNPLLAHGFSAEESRPPVRDPNLRPQGGRRAFMNSRNQEPTPKK